MTHSTRSLVILYDGVCGLCNRTVQFVLRRDHHDKFEFAALQSDFAKRVLQRQGPETSMESVLLFVRGRDETDQVLAKSDAGIRILRELGGVWALAAGALAIFPRFIRDWGYDLVARHRYRLFGRYESCPLPSEKNRSKFIDQG